MSNDSMCVICGFRPSVEVGPYGQDDSPLCLCCLEDLERERLGRGRQRRTDDLTLTAVAIAGLFILALAFLDVAMLCEWK